MATPASSIVPADHLIVVAMRVHEYALRCEKVLAQAGFPVRVCPDGVTASDVIEAVETYHLHLLIIDDDIEWAEGVHVVLRLHADPEFAALDVLMLLRRASRIPAGMGHERYHLSSGLTKPFDSRELVGHVRRILQALSEGDAPAVSAPIFSRKRTEAEWQSWKQQLPPFALFESAWDGDRAHVERLIAQGVDVNARDWLGATPLHLAINRNNTDVIPLLLDAGAEIDARDGNGNTALFRAVSFAYTTMIRLLLERGADPNATDAQGETVLQRAHNCHRPEIERLLRNHEAQR